MFTILLAALGVSGVGTGALTLSPVLRHWIGVKLGISDPYLNEIIAPISTMITQLTNHAATASESAAYHAKLADTHAGEAAAAKNYATNLKAQLAPPQKQVA